MWWMIRVEWGSECLYSKIRYRSYRCNIIGKQNKDTKVNLSIVKIILLFIINKIECSINKII